MTSACESAAPAAICKLAEISNLAKPRKQPLPCAIVIGGAPVVVASSRGPAEGLAVDCDEMGVRGDALGG